MSSILKRLQAIIHYILYKIYIKLQDILFPDGSQLSKECRKEMQYYRLLAKEVEKRIQTLKPLISESDTESSEDKTDAPDLPESEHSYEISQNDVQDGFNVHVDKTKTVTTEKCLDDCEISRVQPTSNTFDN
ncbi:jg18174, partial [Pararge aegeria aegeria]